MRAKRPLLLVCLGLALLSAVPFVGFGLFKPSHIQQPTTSLRRVMPPPPPHLDSPFAPAALRPLTPAEAIEWNATVPDVAVFNPPATPFIEPTANLADYQNALGCLTTAIYYEAASEPRDGQRAVAQIVLNRVRHVVYPHSVCGVVFEGAQRKTGCQFSFVCDGSLLRPPDPAVWQRVQGVAAVALGGYVYAPVGLATNYHAAYVVPYWAASLDKIATIGAHIFYRIQGAWGMRPAFRASYAGGEVPMSSLQIAGAPGLNATEGGLGASNRAPIDVAVTDRPVLIRDTGASPDMSSVKPRPKPAEAATVAPQDRWIVPHTETGSTADSQTTERSVIMPAGEPKS